MTYESYILLSLITFFIMSFLFKNKALALYFGALFSVTGFVVMSPLFYFEQIFMIPAFVCMVKDYKVISNCEKKAFFYLILINGASYLLREQSFYFYFALLIFFQLFGSLNNKLDKSSSLKVFFSIAMIISLKLNFYFLTNLLTLILCFLYSNIFTYKGARNNLSYDIIKIFYIPITLLIVLSELRTSISPIEQSSFYILLFVLILFYILKSGLAKNQENMRDQLLALNTLLIALSMFEFSLFSLEFGVFLLFMNVGAYVFSFGNDALARFLNKLSAFAPAILVIFAFKNSIVYLQQSFSDTYLSIFICLALTPLLLYISLIRGKLHEI